MSVAGLLPSWPRIAFQVAFNVGGTQVATPYWTDLTWRLQGGWTAIQAGRQYEHDAVQSGTMDVTLWNTDGAFDSTNTSSPYSPNVLPFRYARMVATWPPTQNLLPQSLANGSSVSFVEVTTGSDGVATGLAAAPSGQTSAIFWTYGASAAGVGVGAGATNPSYSTCDSDAVPVVAQRSTAVGQSWTFSVYLSAHSGGTAGLTLFPRINWYNQAGSQISTSDGGAVTVPVQTSWIRATVTGTAPAGAVWARVEVVNAATTSVSNTVYATGWQYELAAAATSWADPGVTYPLWTGFAERWQQTWQGTALGLVKVPCVDILAGLRRLVMQSNLVAAFLAQKPTQFYPLSEPQNATQFLDATSQRSPLVPGTSSGGAGGATVTAGNTAAGTGYLCDTTVVQFTGNTSSNGLAIPGYAGVYLAAGNRFGPPTTGGWTRLIAIRGTAPSAGNFGEIWGAGAIGGVTGSGNQSAIDLYVDSSGHLTADVWSPPPTTLLTSTVTSVNVCDGAWHLVGLSLSVDGKTMTVYVDGVVQTTSTGSDSHPTGCVYDSIGMIAVPSVGAFGQGFNGQMAYAAEFPSVLSSATVSDLYTGLKSAWAGERSDARVVRVLNLVGWGGAMSTPAPSTLMGAANFNGVDAMSELQLIADSENGQVYSDPAGVVTLAGRKWRYLQTVATVTFGEQTGSGEVPYLGGLGIDTDPDHIYNITDVGNQVAPNATAPLDAIRYDPTSQGEFFPSTLQRAINVQDPSEPIYAAQYLVGQYAQPLPRVSQITIDPSANPSLWPTVLGLQFGTRGTLNRRPNAAAAISLPVFIEHLGWKGDPNGALQLDLQLSPAAPYLNWPLACALHTALFSSATSGTNTIVLKPLTGSASNPAQAVLPQGTVLTVGYGTAAAENVTVLTVPVTTAGYTSVTVTLTANLANNHSTNDVVTQPLPGGVTLPAGVVFPGGLDTAATLTATGPRAAY